VRSSSKVALEAARGVDLRDQPCVAVAPGL